MQKHGKADVARADWRRSADLVARTQDEGSSPANLHRLAADARAAAGHSDSAFAAHARAVQHAYLFQNRPHPPDQYTLEFYAEQVARSLDRLGRVRGALGGDVWERGPTARRGCAGTTGA